MVAKFGLEKSIKFAAGVMTVGCLLRSGVPMSGGLGSAWEGVFGSVANAANTVAGDVVGVVGASVGGGDGSGMMDAGSSFVQVVSDVLPDEVVNAVSDLVDPNLLPEASRVAGLEPYALLVLGTVMVGFAQPYFQW